MKNEKLEKFLRIDGSSGEGGGQILRTSLSLSVLTGRPIEIFNIRAGRKKPGLQRQHLVCVEAVTKISDAKVSGAKIGLQFLRFEPKKVKPGRYEFDIGTAGSTSLVIQTVLLPLAFGHRPSEILLIGGTHNPFAPPF
ncbi:RNA 3'-terminal phosphate cyclase, partial [Candidatus Kuenenbacteria bacterium]|nr:RNA 3'-terminal phosphate cyclase [Candidatus Kuenenbacteria bacterium]